MDGTRGDTDDSSPAGPSQLTQLHNPSSPATRGIATTTKTSTPKASGQNVHHFLSSGSSADENPSISEEEKESSASDKGGDTGEQRYHQARKGPPTFLRERRRAPTVNGTIPPSSNAGPPPSSFVPPRLPFSRGVSMPLPSQLTHLRRPNLRSSPSSATSSAFSNTGSSTSQRFRGSTPPSHELSLELADSAQTVIQTLLQLSPPHLLDPAKEALSSCTLQLPTASVAALLTAMKNLNYMSRNLEEFGLDSDETISEAGEEEREGETEPSLRPKDTFDIGETLQSAGDVLSGVAAQAGVDLVLFHGDVSLKHVSVIGDECGLAFALSHILHQIIGVARPGDTLELGLHVASPPTSTTLESPTSSLEPPRTTLTCSIEITHIYGTLCPPTETEERSDPQFGALLLRRILNHLHATLHTNPATVEEQGKSYLLTLPLLQSPLPSRSPTPSTQSRAPHPSLSLSLATEPSINELTLFAERTLKGKKAIFYASEKSSFAIHLTAYLTAWGMDVSHISTDTPSEEGAPGESEVVDGGAKPKTPGVKPGKEKELEVPPQVISASEDDDPILPIPDPEPTASPSLVSNLSLPPTASDQSFIIIDDSISILREHLIKFRPPSPAPTPPTNSTTSSTTPRDQRPRPQLGSNHRPKSTPHIRQFTPTESTSINKDTLSSPTPIAITATTPTPSTTPGATPKRPTRSRRSTTATAATPPANSIVIVHFTSLTNYKLVKDLVQSLLSSAAQQGYQYPPHPEILVVPKPAGPRRFLTALHTAVYKPVVDPFFTPIATSPFSPGGTGGSWGMGSLFPSQSTSTLGKRNPITPSPLRHPLSPSSPTNSNSRRSPTGHHPTPTLEYFSETAPKLSAQSAASGVVLQSPDGTPAGIFFQPQPQPSSLREQRFESVMMERSNATMGPSDADDGKSSDNAEIARVQQQQRRKSSRMTPTGENQPKDIASVPLSPSQSATSTASASRNLPSVLGSLAELVKSGVPLDSASRQSSPIRPTAHPLTEHSSSESMMPNSQDSSMTKVPTLASTSPPASPTIASARPPMKKEGRSLSKSGEVPKAKGKHDRKDDEIVPPIRVLVVEDNSINRRIITTFMERKRVQYGQATNGLEAIEEWRTGKYHLILMDIDMPIMGGIEATKEIRRLERLQGIGISTPPVEDSPVDLPSAAAQPRIPLSTAPLSASSVVIVALTAHNLPADRTKALTAGCNDFISKPVRLNWLNNKIIEWGSIKALQSYAQFAASEQNASASKEQPSHPNSTISLNSPSRPDFGTTLTAPPLSTTELRPAMAVDSHSAPPSTQTSSEPVEISGDEALRIHLADTRRVSSGAQDKDQPLGTRAPSAETNATSIASVMHGGSSTTERNPRVGSQPNSRAIPLQSVPTTGDASFKPPG